MAHEIVVTIFVLAGFLVVAVASSVLLNRLRFPYTIGLVIIGFIFGLILRSLHYPLIGHLNLTPQIILYLILPTLIYDAAINMDLKALGKNLVPILLLAVVGLLISAGIIGGALSTFTAMTLGAALLFGALISATDPVAVIALFNEIGAPRRLATLLDGESIFNDATAIVLFTIVLSALQSGVSSMSGLMLRSFGSFFWILVGGLLVGVIVGGLGGLFVRIQKDSTVLQLTVSLIMAYASFMTADLLHVSGVISTLAAGITVSLLSNDVVKHENHYFMVHFWEYFSFVANSFVFLLLGLTESNSFSDFDTVKRSGLLLLAVIPAVTLARAAAVYVLIPLYNQFTRNERIPLSFQTVVFWGGLRGAVPVALVLAIPLVFPGRSVIIHITFGYILFTLLVQGTTVKGLMSALGIKPERSYFDYHKGVSYSLDFPTARLAELMIARIVESLKEEGFFVSGGEGEAGGMRLLSRGQKHLTLEQNGNELVVTAANAGDLTYGKQTIYETLLDLDNAVSSLKEIVKSPELTKIVKEEPTEYHSSLNIAKYLTPSLIRVSLQGEDKESVITELVDLVARHGTIGNRDEVLEAVFEREASMSTGFEHGIAMPHAKIDAAENIVLAVGIHKTGVDFGSLDGQPSKLFFLVISPKSHVGPHIQLLAELGRKLSNPGVRQSLEDARDAADVIATLSH